MQINEPLNNMQKQKKTLITRTKINNTPPKKNIYNAL